jgi:putative ABC transport system permease protein
MRTFLTAGGVAISVGFIVFLISLGFGLQRVSTTQIANLEALQILDVVAGKSKIVSVNSEALEKFEGVEGVTEVQPQLSLASRLKLGSSEIDGVVYGKNLEYLALEQPKITSGRKYTSNTSNEAIINTAGQTQFAAADIIGKQITVNTVLKPELLAPGENVKSKKVTVNLIVVGVIDDKSAPYIYVPLDVLTAEGATSYTGAKVKVANKDQVDKARVQIENLGFKATSIKDTVDQINSFFSIFQVVLMSFGAIAIIVACLGMFNTLTISLLEKTREVGFMKALGTTRRDIYRLFISESILIGSLGSFVGIIIGVMLGVSLNLSIAGLAKATGNQAVEIFYTPVLLIVVIVTVSVAISFFTGLYPARRAARINALDAMRYE